MTNQARAQAALFDTLREGGHEDASYRGGAPGIDIAFNSVSGKRTRTCRRSTSTTRATVTHPDVPASFDAPLQGNAAKKLPEPCSSILRSAGSVFRWAA